MFWIADFVDSISMRSRKLVSLARCVFLCATGKADRLGGIALATCDVVGFHDCMIGKPKLKLEIMAIGVDAFGNVGMLVQV